MALQVQWLFNNELVSADYQIQTFGDVHSLHIGSVQDKDAGRFSVIAENSSGKAWCSALLVVVEASQLMPDEGSPPETPQGPYIQPVVGPMPLHTKVHRLIDQTDVFIHRVVVEKIYVGESIFGSRPSDHYFRSVCLLVCLFVCAEFFSAVFDPISIKLGHMLYVWV